MNNFFRHCSTCTIMKHKFLEGTKIRIKILIKHILIQISFLYKFLQSVNYFNARLRCKILDIIKFLRRIHDKISLHPKVEHVRLRLASSRPKIVRNTGDLYLSSNYRHPANVPVGQIYIDRFACSTTSRAMLGYRPVQIQIRGASRVRV